MDAPDRLPRLDFDEHSAPPEHQFELFHDTTAPVFDTVPVGSPDGFAARATDVLVDDLIVSRIAHRPQTMRRTARHVATSGGEMFAVQLYTRGGLAGRIGDATLDLDDEHVGIVDLDHPFQVVGTDLDVIWVGIPRSRLAPSGGTADGSPVLRLHRQSPRGRILTSAVEHLWSRVQTASALDGPDLADEIVDVVGCVLAPGDYRPSPSSIAVAVRDYVDAHLDDLDLDADRLMRTFHCSRSSLFRMFDDVGGVSTYIREQRLLRCLDELLAPAEPDARVHRVATRWGFENPSHFNRLFKTRFGVPPSSVRARPGGRATAVHPESTAAMIDEFHRWATRR